jgi:hypothetical protein
MKIEEMIEQYDKGNAERIEAEKKQLQELIADRRGIFERYAKLCLGDLWDQLSPKGTEVSLRNHNSGADFRIPVSWNNASGFISQGINFEDSKWSKIFLDFGQSTDGKHAIFLKEELTGLGTPVFHLGQLFSDLKKCVEYSEEQRLIRRERNIFQALDFAGYGEEGIAHKLKTSLEEYPELAEKIQANAAARRKELADIADRKLHEQLAYELRQSEEAQLQLLADYAWNGPFVIYRIDYGARIDGVLEDGGEFYTDHLFTLDPLPNADGYYSAFGKGEYKRLIKPEHIIATEILTITNVGEAPLDLRRFIELQSKNISDVSIMVYLPARELFVFDYDQIQVAVEALQDKEISDAAQEDIS